MKILVLQPVRPSNPPALRAVADALLARLPAANPEMCFDIRQDDAQLEIPPHPSLYQRHATVRNYMLDTYLTDDHDAVLWVDSDLIDYPADLPTRLRGVMERKSLLCPQCGSDETGKMFEDIAKCAGCQAAFSPWRAIVAPLALLSPSSGWQQRFYDIGGFIEQGSRARMFPPWFDGRGDVIELDSVGCCYLAPADLYHSQEDTPWGLGLRYSPPPTDYYVEHWSVMQAARKRGYRICALTTAVATHAWLPDYGLEAN